jgi:uncharacterized protein (DUF1697 family)
MQTYIALLRGINVSGHNIIKMAELRQLCTELGFENVTTYIQSGNIIFQSKEKNKSKIENIIIDAIKKQFNYTINTLVLTKAALKTIFTLNPFIQQKDIDISKIYVTLLKNTPDLSLTSHLEKARAFNNDDFKIIHKSVYLHYQNSARFSKLSNNLIEKKLKSPATSRNWKTITKLVELSNL